MKRHKPRLITREALQQMRRDNFKPSFSVMIETAGPDKYTLLPILEHVAGFNTDGSGTCLMNMVWDADWAFPRGMDTKARGGLQAAEVVFNRLAPIAALLRPYVRLRLLHDFDPDKRFKVLKTYKKGRPPKMRTPQELAAVRRRNNAKRYRRTGATRQKRAA